MTDLEEQNTQLRPDKKPSHWQIIADCIQGTSHIAANTPCQDYFCAQAHIPDNTKPENTNLLIFVADGAGSAKYGEAGTILSCETALLFTQNALVQGIPLNHDFAVKCVSQVVQTLNAQAQKHGQRLAKQHKEKQASDRQQNEAQVNTLHGQNLFEQSPSTTDESENFELPTLKDFACTFLGLIATPTQTLLMQIGDGAIVVAFNEAEDPEGLNLQLPIRPMQGEYSNMTHFITENKALEYLQTKLYDKPLYQAAVMTDGLQRLALVSTEYTPHQAFFAPFFKQLAANKDTTALQTALSQFMQSVTVNDRTDDDKTLVLAQWHS